MLSEPTKSVRYTVCTIAASELAFSACTDDNTADSENADLMRENSLEDKKLIEEKRCWLVDAVAGYCRDYLDDEYRQLCQKLIDKMSRKRNVPFLSGKIEIWAAAVVYAIGQINFLFDKDFEPYTTPDDICNHFGAKKSTVSNKARDIREMFKMRNWDNEFSTSEMRQHNPFNDMVIIDGLLLPKSALPPEILKLLKD